MVDMLLRRFLVSALGPAAARLGWSGVAVACAGLVLALAGLPAIAWGLPLAGVAALAVSRALFVLASACPGEAAGKRLGEVLGAVSLAGFPFAFALAAPEHAPACAFLMFGLSALIAAGFAYPNVHWGGFGGFDITVLLGLCALLPEWFGPIAYAGGVMCFVASGIRIDAGRRDT